MFSDGLKIFIVFRRHCIVAKRAFYFRHVRLSLRPSAFISMAPTRRLPMKFDIGDFHEKSVKKKSKLA